jgi:hypothetical protein
VLPQCWKSAPTGSPPQPDTTQLENMLKSAGLGGIVVNLELIPERRVVLKPDDGRCHRRECTVGGNLDVRTRVMN